MTEKKRKKRIENMPILKSGYVTGPKKEQNGLFVMQLVRNADLRVMHDGMKSVCKRNGINVSDILPGSCVIFVNGIRKYVKILVGTGNDYPVVACYKFPPGRMFEIDAMADIALAFKGPSRVDANERLRQAVDKFYKRKERKVERHVN